MSRLWISAAELADLIGKDNARLLGQCFGGVGHYIPVEAVAQHPFAKIIGMDALRGLCAAYGGEYVNLPNYKKAKIKKVGMLQRLEAGASPREVAEAFETTERYAQYLATERRRAEAAPQAQRNLFDV